MAAAGLVLAAAAYSAGHPAGREETSVAPGINKQYVAPHVEDELHRLEAEHREAFRLRHDIVRACDARPGLIVADVGAGTGLFTRLLATQVGPGGKVYAVDISRPFVQRIEKLAREQHAGNIVGVVSRDTSVELPRPRSTWFSCATRITISNTRRRCWPRSAAVRPAGRLIVVDYKREKGVNPDWVLKHVRADRNTVLAEITAAGFKLVDEPAKFHDEYMLRFAKDTKDEAAARQ